MLLFAIILFIQIEASHCTLCVNAGGLEFEGKCYRRFNAESTWTGARYTCSFKEGKQLVTVDRQEVNTIVQNNLTRGSDVWIGLRIANINKPNWKWSDGGNISSYDDWNDAVINSACAVMKYGGADSLRYWYTIPCQHNIGYICEKEMSYDNCSDWLSFDTHCYSLINDHTSTNMDAARYCWENEAYLVSINNQEEAGFIYRQIKEGTEYWIGLSPLQWVSGARYQWNNWDDSGPHTNKSCAYMNRTSGKWSSAYCESWEHKRYPSICEEDVMEIDLPATMDNLHTATSNVVISGDSYTTEYKILNNIQSPTDFSKQTILTVIVPAACGGCIIIIVIIVLVIVVRRKRRSKRSKQQDPPQKNTTTWTDNTVGGGNAMKGNTGHHPHVIDPNTQGEENYIYEEAEVVQTTNDNVVVNGDVYALVDKGKSQNLEVHDKLMAQQHAGATSENKGKQEISNGQGHIIIGSDVYAIVDKNKVKPNKEQKSKQKKKKPAIPHKLEDKSDEKTSNGPNHIVVGSDVYAIVDKDKITLNAQQKLKQKTKSQAPPPKLEDKSDEIISNGQHHIAVGSDKDKTTQNKQNGPKKKKKKPAPPPKLEDNANVINEGNVYNNEFNMNTVPANPTKHNVTEEKITDNTGVVYADLDLSGSGAADDASEVVFSDVRN